MKVGELREALKGVPDDIEVYIQGTGTLWIEWSDTAEICYLTKDEAIPGPGIPTISGEMCLLIT